MPGGEEESSELVSEGQFSEAQSSPGLPQKEQAIAVPKLTQSGLVLQYINWDVRQAQKEEIRHVHMPLPSVYLQGHLLFQNLAARVKEFNARLQAGEKGLLLEYKQMSTLRKRLLVLMMSSRKQQLIGIGQLHKAYSDPKRAPQDTPPPQQRRKLSAAKLVPSLCRIGPPSLKQTQCQQDSLSREAYRQFRSFVEIEQPNLGQIMRTVQRKNRLYSTSKQKMWLGKSLAHLRWEKSSQPLLSRLGDCFSRWRSKSKPRPADAGSVHRIKSEARIRIRGGLPRQQQSVQLVPTLMSNFVWR